MSAPIMILHWLPRILAILIIALTVLLSLDAFSPELTWFQGIVGFFMHLIPSFLLVGLTWLSWKRGMVGGLLFLLLGIVYLAWAWQRLPLSGSLPLAIPVLATGLLFILDSRLHHGR